MATYKQLVKPNTTIRVGIGWCLVMARLVYDVPAWQPSAWAQWRATKKKHRTRKHPKNVSVPIWFSHTGTYGGVYANWGHVAVWVPGKGYLTSPALSSYGQEWYQSIAEIERNFASKYVGWSEDIGGVAVVQKVTSKTPTKPATSSTAKHAAENATTIGRKFTMGIYKPAKPINIKEGALVRIKSAKNSFSAIGANRTGYLTATLWVNGKPGTTFEARLVKAVYDGKNKLKKVTGLRAVTGEINSKGRAKIQVSTAYKTGEGERIQPAISTSTSDLTVTRVNTDNIR